MKFRIQVSNGSEPWWEEYDKPIKGANVAKAYAENMIEQFNLTLGKHENPRTLHAVEVIDSDSQEEHVW